YDVPRVGILLSRAGSELQRIPREQCQVIRQRTNVMTSLARGRGEDVAGDAGAVLEYLADRCAARVDVRIIGPIATECRIEIDLARRGKLPNRDLREQLVDRAEIEGGLDVVARAVGLLDDRGTIVRNEHHTGELLRRREAVDCRTKPW